MAGDWTGVALVLAVAFAIFLLKFIFIRCFFKRSVNRSRNDLSWIDSQTYPSSRNYFQGNQSQLYFYPDYPISLSNNYNDNQPVELTGCFGGKTKPKPPPSFEKALKCSTPVIKSTTIDIPEEDEVDEEPPPTYEECQIKAYCSASQVKPTTTSSIVPTHTHTTTVL